MGPGSRPHGDPGDRRGRGGSFRRRLADTPPGHRCRKRRGAPLSDGLPRRRGRRSGPRLACSGEGWWSSAGTTSPTSSAATSPTFPRTITSAACGWGRRGFGSCCIGLFPSKENADRLAELIAANAEDERREVMWGSPGTMLAAAAMHELTGEERWLELWRESAAWLRAEWDPQTGLWTQRLYGMVEQFIGPAHGFAGCVLALSHDADDEVHRRAAETTARYAVEEDGLANWPPTASMESLQANRDGSIRTQWCHGAPGVVASLARCRARRRRARAAAARGWRAHLARRPARRRARTSATARPATDTRSWRSSSAPGTSSGSSEPARSRCTRSPRWHAHARSSAAAATRSGPAIREPRSTSPTAWPGAEPSRCPRP